MSGSLSNLSELASFLEEFEEPRIVVSGDYRILAANRAYRCEFDTCQSASVVGRLCYEVSHHFETPCDQAGESCPLQSSRASGQLQRVLHLHYTSRGEEHVDVETTPIRDQKGAVAYFVETLRVVRHASGHPAAQGLVGRSAPFKRMLARVMRVAPSMAAAMLQGETGTGKELVARVIHEASPRSRGPFVTLDCSGLSETLFESEMFGYEKGAFTGANHRKLGLVEVASGGTLFLDEIGELPLSQQVKLLRLLETGTFRRIGSVETLRTDFRLVTATHRNLADQVRDGRFRRDLYFRINTFPIRIPSLRERADDLPMLAASLLERVAPNRKLRLSPDALETLARLPFEGNIRELRNLMERASLLADADVIEPAHLLDEDEFPQALPRLAKPDEQTFLTLQEVESRYLDWACAQHSGDRMSLANRLGIGERTLFRKLNQLRQKKSPPRRG